MISFFRFVLTLFLLSKGPIFVSAQSFESVPAVFDPASFGIEAGAVEVPELRTEKTITFRLPNGYFTQVSDGSDRFTRDEHGMMVPVSDVGEETKAGIVFNRLPRSTRVIFDNDAPAYTYHHNGHFFRLTFAGRTKATFETPNTVSYKLSEHATLRFTVQGAAIHKAITVDGPIDPGILNFKITQDQTLLQRSQSGGLVLETATGAAVFRASPPLLLDQSKNTLDHPITIRSLGNGNYTYEYDPKGLPSVYIIDPTTCYNSPGTVVNDNSAGAISWTDPDNARSSNNAYAKTVLVLTTSQYLKATNFSFQIPYGTVRGVSVRIERHGYDSVSIKDDVVKLVMTGSIIGDNKANTSDFWPQNDTAAQYPNLTSDTELLWGMKIHSSQVNRTDFGVALAAKCLDDICGQRMEEFTVFVDHIVMAVTYAQQCEGSTGATLTSDIAMCVKPKKLSGGNFYPLTGTGIPLCSNTGCYAILSKVGSSVLGPDVHAYEDGAVYPGNPNYIIDDQERTDYPSKIHFVAGTGSTNLTTFVSIADVPIQFQPMCDSSKIYASYSGSIVSSVFHFVPGTSGDQYYNDEGSGGIVWGGTGYTLFVPKSYLHDRVRVCTGKRDVGCTINDTWFSEPPPYYVWSFYANDVGQITTNSGWPFGFDASNIRVSIESPGYWKIAGVTGTGGQGESSSSDGGGTAVPEFSAIGLVTVLAICGYIMKMKLVSKKGEV